jgi:hypothetical protein
MHETKRSEAMERERHTSNALGNTKRGRIAEAAASVTAR